MLTAFAVPYLQVLAGPISRRTRSKTTFLTQHINESFYENLPSPDIAVRMKQMNFVYVWRLMEPVPNLSQRSTTCRSHDSAANLSLTNRFPPPL